jgi:hypothetical protein
MLLPARKIAVRLHEAECLIIGNPVTLKDCVSYMDRVRLVENLDYVYFLVQTIHAVVTAATAIDHHNIQICAFLTNNSVLLLGWHGPLYRSSGEAGASGHSSLVCHVSGPTNGRETRNSQLAKIGGR